jgi:hypothetical protein
MCAVSFFSSFRCISAFQPAGSNWGAIVRLRPDYLGKSSLTIPVSLELHPEDLYFRRFQSPFKRIVCRSPTERKLLKWMCVYQSGIEIPRAPLGSTRAMHLRWSTSISICFKTKLMNLQQIRYPTDYRNCKPESWRARCDKCISRHLDSSHSNDDTLISGHSSVLSFQHVLSLSRDIQSCSRWNWFAIPFKPINSSIDRIDPSLVRVMTKFWLISLWSLSWKSGLGFWISGGQNRKLWSVS